MKYRNDNDYFADFYLFGCGNFLKTATIPDHKTSIGTNGHLSNFFYQLPDPSQGLVYVVLIKTKHKNASAVL
jgi:hypothetical protein